MRDRCVGLIGPTVRGRPADRSPGLVWGRVSGVVEPQAARVPFRPPSTEGHHPTAHRQLEQDRPHSEFSLFGSKSGEMNT